MDFHASRDAFFCTGLHWKTHSQPQKPHTPAPWDHHNPKLETDLSLGPAQDLCAGTLAPLSLCSILHCPQVPDSVDQ